MKSDFKKLQAKWYKKLKSSGFHDIEEPDSPREMLKQWALELARPSNALKFQEKRDYFLKATHFLNDYKFKSLKERKVWELHSDGLSLMQTAKKVRLSKSWVGTIVLKLQRIMLSGNYN